MVKKNAIYILIIVILLIGYIVARPAMVEKNVIFTLILLVGIYVFARPADDAEKLKKFYSQYPLVRYYSIGLCRCN